MKLMLAIVLFFIGYANSYAVVGDWIDLTKFNLWSNTYATTTIWVIPPAGTPIVNSNGCLDPDSYMVLASLPVEAQQRIYSTLLAAKMANSPIRLRIEGCESNRPAILNVILNE